MSKIKKLIIFIGDLIILYGALALTLVVRYGPSQFEGRWGDHLFPFSIIFVFWIIIFYAFNLYDYKISKTHNSLNNIFTASFLAGVISILLLYFFPNFFEISPKTNIIIFGLLVMALKYGWYQLSIFKLFTHGSEKIIIIGNSEAIEDTVSYITNNPQVGYSIGAWLDDPEKINIDGLIKVMGVTKAKTIVIPNHLTKKVSVSKLIYKLLSYEVNVISFWNFYEIIFEKIPLEEMEEGWFIENISAHKPLYQSIKIGVDTFLASILLIIFSPLLVLFSFLVKLTSSGPVIYKQNRLGKNERLFTLYKFRTMEENAEKDGPKWASKNDKRTTTIGRILRRTHLDELPQLINVLKGDLSFVGPRPERPEFVEKLEKKIPFYEIRHIVKPGITGWAQVMYRYGASIEDSREKLKYDLHYIRKSNLTLDILIIIKTIRMFFFNN